MFTELSAASDCKRPVLFNHRLLSSTPLDTPVKKTLVERNGVLYLNGSTDTQILNATDDAMALRPPCPPRPPGPQLIGGQIQFVPNPIQFQSPFQDPSTIALGMHEQSRSVPSGTKNVKTAPTGYSLYSSAGSELVSAGLPSSQPHASYTVADAARDHSVVAQSVAYTQSGVPTDHLRSVSSLPYSEYSLPAQGTSSALTNGYSAYGFGTPASVVNTIYTSSGAGVQPSAVSRSLVPGSRGNRDGERPFYSTPAVNTSVNHLLSSAGSAPYGDNSLTLQDFKNHPSSGCCCGVGTPVTAGNSIYTSSGARSSGGRQIPAHSNLIHHDGVNQTHVKHVPLKKAIGAGGGGRAAGKKTVPSNEQNVVPDPASSRQQPGRKGGSDQGKCTSASEAVGAAQIVTLLKQLREVVVANRESEIVQLLNEICAAARIAPVTSSIESPVTVPSKPEVGGVDIEAVLQPLRSDNARMQR